MSTKMKLCIPLGIIMITLSSAVLAGYINRDKNQEVFTRTVLTEEVLTNEKNLVLNIIKSNTGNSSVKDKKLIADGIQNHMQLSYKEKNEEEKLMLYFELQDLQEIMKLEQKDSFYDMSLEARIPAMKILSTICEQYGIYITYNSKGDIVKVKESSGANIYENERAEGKIVIRLKALIVTLILIICFVIVCIYITKKKQLFKKDGRYDGYSKEGFA